jgi:hypothetical protein
MTVKRFCRSLGIFVAFGVNCFAQHGGGGGASSLLVIGFAIVALWLVWKLTKKLLRIGIKHPVRPQPVRQEPTTIPIEGLNRKAIFVSYRREDTADVTGRVTDALAQKFDRRSIFKDVDSIEYGEDFRRAIRGAITQCQVVLAIIGKNWAGPLDSSGKTRLDRTHDQVRIEIEVAFEEGKTIIPVFVMGARMPEEETLPESLRRIVYLNGIAIRADPDFSGDVERLIQSLGRRIVK